MGSSERTHRKIECTPEEPARLKAMRERFQKERPSLDSLVASGEYSEPIPRGDYLDLQQSLRDLKDQREKAGLSLADVAERSGMDRAAISRLENGKQPNPTLDTLGRYAAALGKRLVWAVRDVGNEAPTSATAGSEFP